MFFQRALALEALGRKSEALDQVSQALDLSQSSGIQWDTWQLFALRAKLNAGAGETKSSEADLKAAASIIHVIAEGAGDDNLAESFLNRVDVAEIIAATSFHPPHVRTNS
jgi:hypothetical protein